MTLPILNILENLGVPSLASEVIVLNEPFDWSKTNDLILQVNESMTFAGIELGKRKKIIKIVTEALDNVCKHASIYPNQQVSSFICHLGAEDKLYISTRNLIPNEQLGNIVMVTQHLNQSNQEELNTMYRKQLKQGKLSPKGDAGLGLIEIARKSSEKLRYTAEYFDVTNSYLTFLITIDLTNY